MTTQTSAPSMDFATARFNMVEQQVRPWDVLDQDVLDLLGRLPREDFVPAQYQRLAYADVEVPLSDDASALSGSARMLPPRVEGRILQALNLAPADRVLVIGTGSGFLTAAIAQLAREVVSLEIDPALHAAAGAALARHHITNALLLCEDGLQGNTAHGPYDAIVVSGATATSLPGLRQQLKTGGRLFQVTGRAPAMAAQLVQRTAPDQWHSDNLFETVLGYLRGAHDKPRFQL